MSTARSNLDRASQASRRDTRAAPGAAGTAEPGIAVRGVSKLFRRGPLETLRLAAVALELARGEFAAIVGPSGCGKSTLMRLVAGLIMPSKGELAVFGRRVAGPVTDLGIVFQSPILLDWRDVLANVLFQVEI